jgi:hypothetical protein
VASACCEYGNTIWFMLGKLAFYFGYGERLASNSPGLQRRRSCSTQRMRLLIVFARLVKPNQPPKLALLVLLHHSLIFEHG